MSKRKLLVMPLVVLGLAGGVGCERKIVNETAPNLAASACFTCHTDQDNALLAAKQEWENSVHASGNNIDRNRKESSRYQSCEKCHSHEGFVTKVTGVFPGDTTNRHFTVIGCFTCHAPHTNGNLTLRTESSVTLANGVIFDREAGNLCANCHQSRTDIRTLANPTTLTNRFGPHHSNQGDMLMGTGGYEYGGYEYESSAHKNVATEGCINCHMAGGFANLVGGHTFNMANEEREFENLVGCNASQCHNGALTSLDPTADEDFNEDGTTEGAQDEVEGLVEELRDELFTAGLLEWVVEGADSSLLPKESKVTSKDSAGAVYNYLFVHEDRSEGIHNTEYAVGLLKSSLHYIATGDPNGVAPRDRRDLLAAH